MGLFEFRFIQGDAERSCSCIVSLLSPKNSRSRSSSEASLAGATTIGRSIISEIWASCIAVRATSSLMTSASAASWAMFVCCSENIARTFSRLECTARVSLWCCMCISSFSIPTMLAPIVFLAAQMRHMYARWAVLITFSDPLPYSLRLAWHFSCSVGFF